MAKFVANIMNLTWSALSEINEEVSILRTFQLKVDNDLINKL